MTGGRPDEPARSAGTPPPASVPGTPPLAAAASPLSPLVSLPAAEPLSLGRELARKGIHLSSIAMPLAYAAGLPRAVVASALLLLLAGALIVEIARARSARAGALFARAAGVLLRAHEHREISGATWLLASFVVCTLLFERDVAVAAMCAVSLGDAAAAVVGRTLGRRRLGARKSLEGSIACFAATYLAARTIAALAPAESLVAALAASAAEWPEGPLDDNLRMAIATGAGILLWRFAFS